MFDFTEKKEKPKSITELVQGMFRKKPDHVKVVAPTKPFEKRSSTNRNCMKLIVKPLRDGVVVPEYAHSSDAGMDLFSTGDTGAIVDAGAQIAISTGIAVAIPEGYVGIIMDKSGLASKHGLKVMGGVIDSGYRGELNVMLLNTGRERVTIKSSQKIAQMLIIPVIQADIEIGDLPEASDDRGEGGFGSTGLEAKKV